MKNINEKLTRIGGFTVRVLDGKELTEAQFARLPEWEQQKVKKKVNGPHHDAKWARDLKLKVK